MSTFHCWELYVFTVREAVRKIKRLWNQQEKYVQNKLRHKEIKSYLCKEKCSLFSIWWHKGAFVGAWPVT